MLTKLIQVSLSYKELESKTKTSAFERGRHQLELGNFLEAAADFEQAIVCDPNDPGLYVWLASALTALQEYEKALDALEKAIEIKRCNGDLHFRRGCVLYYLKDYESAIRDFDKAIQQSATGVLHYWRGKAWRQLYEYDAAIADFSATIAAGEYLADVLVDRGEAFLFLDETQNAIRDLSQAIQLGANNCRAWALRGKALMQENDDELAIKDFDRALCVDPKNEEALRARSQLRTELGDFHGAEADLDVLDEIQYEQANDE